MAAGATTLVGQAVLNIAVPSMRQSIGATAADVQWIVAGYSLAFGLALVPGGSLGDLHGRKLLFMAGMAVFLRSRWPSASRRPSASASSPRCISTHPARPEAATPAPGTRWLPASARASSPWPCCCPCCAGPARSPAPRCTESARSLAPGRRPEHP
ncbi:MFS transporter [Streptomyces sp. NPDC102395]|uniref:MFS transporter n=1 Tax=Streptomyces sp. NPDC102395 TaxID=3366168 RepID=UPI00381FCD19